ncbi:homoserine kinase [Candidatus Symbiobacter mobilis]|uniref:Homoserine kinase n=1 Tax=Candidatus Symbiobacter mobilis CR TaxID=946483 RepID=U5NBL6_9BURK|nr:homoserine kinase [Candidatus Symbiobacter mobilis]AGX87633.1 homoserine kinase type II [Candidatus Symbiobacter mobilis CR]
MAVYTEVSFAQASELLSGLGLGTLRDMQGCPGGIENTNYFVTTERDGVPHGYVLTLFERLDFDQLPFYLRLMEHLALRCIPVPRPHANARGELVFRMQGKPASVVDRLRGSAAMRPGSRHCAQVGVTLARMHLAGHDFPLYQPHLRGLPWCIDTAEVVRGHLDAEQATLLDAEIALQRQTLPAYAALPRGPIHADLFRDNVLFADAGVEGNPEGGPDGDLATGPVLSGVFDFYFAGIDTWLFDLAVTLNDWCVDPQTGAEDPVLSAVLIDAYDAVRPLEAAERELLVPMLRAGALRFWLSRLWDWYLPRDAKLLRAHDPRHFERVLRHRAARKGPSR